MKCKKSIAIISAVLFCYTGFCQQVYIIPKQTFQPYKILGFSEIDTAKVNFKMAINSFEISSQITFKQYKFYLESIKKDSSYNFYLSQLPDSSIASKEHYADYISNKKYDNFPVAGISWDDAMNYCKWKTIQDNKDNDLKFIYRLPKLSEWLAAYNFLETSNRKNDFSKHFSDWTMNTYFEALVGSRANPTFTYDWFFDLPKATDRPGVKRKMVAGNSYLFQTDLLIYSFATFTFYGYRQIAFRLVKEEIKNSDDRMSLYKEILAWWNIKNELAK